MSMETAFEVGRLYPLIKSISEAMAVNRQALFMRLPGLEGYFPGGTIDDSGSSINLVDDGENLSDVGTCQVGYDGQTYRRVGDGTSYLWNDGHFGVKGTETWIASSIRGLTLGGWFRIAEGPASIPTGIAGKYGAATQYGYLLLQATDDTVYWNVSGNGTVAPNVQSAIVVADDAWHFVVGRFTPSTELAIFVDETKAVNTTSIPSSVHDSTADFEVGRYAANNLYIQDLLWRDLFICQASLGDSLIADLYQASVP